jgi:uncharacterized membrane protein
MPFAMSLLLVEINFIINSPLFRFVISFSFHSLYPDFFYLTTNIIVSFWGENNAFLMYKKADNLILGKFSSCQKGDLTI